MHHMNVCVLQCSVFVSFLCSGWCCSCGHDVFITNVDNLMMMPWSSRGSSTPKRPITYCPFATPDRLGEELSAQEDFESSSHIIRDQVAEPAFSPCIDWMSSMNPTVRYVSLRVSWELHAITFYVNNSACQPIVHNLELVPNLCKYS